MSNDNIGTSFVIREQAIYPDYATEGTSNGCKMYVMCVRIKREIGLFYKNPINFETVKTDFKRKGMNTYHGFMGHIEKRLDQITSMKKLEKIEELLGDGKMREAVKELMR